MKLHLYFSFVFCCFLPVLAQSQVLWTEPAFPTDQVPVTVFFDATKGTGGLANCNCDVYVHTGLITSNSTSNSDWKYVFTTWGQANAAWKMTPVAGQPNVYKWEIAPGIRQRYNVTNQSETIQKLAFVFRNANGSLEGKGEGGTDIFYDVQADSGVFTAGFVSPSASSFFSQIGQNIPVSAASNQSATLTLFQDGIQLTSVVGTSLQYNLPVTTTGTHVVELRANNGTTTITAAFTYVVVGASQIAPLPNGLEPGINYVSPSAITFVLVAPGKQHVFLIGDFNEWQFDTDFQLKKSPDGVFWWITVNGLNPGQTYAFQYVVDGTIRTGDPYSDLILDPNNDNWIEPGVFPNLHPYPAGKTTGIVSLCQPGAPAYPWQTNNFQRPDQRNLIIYEMLLRDFLTMDYNGLKGLLDYLEDLGINAIELMPVNEFDANNSWGYNPTYHYALDKYYGTPDAFRALVDECHARGIAVILDVVFNHAHEKNPLALLYWNEAQFRPAANNPWLNEQATHAFNVFFDFNHESIYTRDYVKRVIRHWLRDYRVDGFRFDLSKGFTQNTNGPFDAGNYDAKRIETIKIYADEMWNTSPGSYCILEHFTANTEETELINYGCMVWSGAGPHNQYLEAAMGYPSNLTSISHKDRGWTKAHLVGYMESHDEERMMYKNLQFGNASGNYKVKDLGTALDRVELANTFFYTIPGPKMLWQFGEVGYDYSINTCEDGVTIDPNCRLARKPIRWDYTYDPDRLDVYNNIRALLHLRSEHDDVFLTNNFELDVDQFWKTIHLNHTSMNVAVLGNFNVTNETFNPKFQHTGTWYEYFTGQTLNVANTNANVTLNPGEFRLYTDQAVALPGEVTSDEEVLAPSREAVWSVFPNPSGGQAWLSLFLENNNPVEWRVVDMQGRKVADADMGTAIAGEYVFPMPNLVPGLYWVVVSVDGKTEVKKWVVGI